MPCVKVLARVEAAPAIEQVGKDLRIDVAHLVVEHRIDRVVLGAHIVGEEAQRTDDVKIARADEGIRKLDAGGLGFAFRVDRLKLEARTGLGVRVGGKKRQARRGERLLNAQRAVCQLDDYCQDKKWNGVGYKIHI